MKAIILPALLSLALAGTSGTVGVEIHKERSFSTRNRGNNLIREIVNNNPVAETLPESLTNGFYSYFATLYIGSDGQKVTPAIDTGSSDLWVMTSSNPYCGRSNFNCSGQIFDPSTSTTFKNLSKPWDISYLDTTGAFGTLANDQVNIGGSIIQDAYFAVANIANSTEDVFGVGYTGNEASMRWYRNGTTGGYRYPNIPVSLKQQGFIEHLAYSLYLNGINAQDGEILFGGVDHAKYEGTLGLVPIVNTYAGRIREEIEFTIMLNGISVRSGNSSCPFIYIQLPVLLDSGTSYALLPNEVVQHIGNSLNYTFNPKAGNFYTGSCDTSKFAYDSLELDFNGIKLQVPPETLLDQATDLDGNPILVDGEKQCMLAIQPTTDIADLILGDVFLRNFYIVYDLENQQIALAQTKADRTDESQVEAIVSTVPSATMAPNYSVTQFQKQIKTVSNYGSCETTRPRMSSIFATSASVSVSKSASSSADTFATAISSASESKSVSTSVGAYDAAKSSALASKSDSTSAGFSATPTYSNSTVIAVSSQAINAGSSKALTSQGPASSQTTYGVTDAIVTGTAVTTMKPTQLTTIPCPSPTTFVYNSETYTVTAATVLTVEDCGCTDTPKGVESSTAETSTSIRTKYAPIIAATVTTEVVDTLITTCSKPTVFSTNGQTYTVIESTVLTITDCPCTVTHHQSASPTSAQASSSSGSSPSSSPSSPKTPGVVSAPGVNAIPIASSTSPTPVLANGAAKMVIGNILGLSVIAALL